jgi:hypothetical protein
MVAAPVVIEMPAQDAALPYARVLVNACTEGLRDRGPCALEDSTSQSAYAVVIVSWDSPAHTAAKIEVGVRKGQRADWLARHVTFNATDAEGERWRSVGLIVATLVGEAGADHKAEQQVPPAEQTPPQETPVRPIAAPGGADAEKPAAPIPPRDRAWLLDGAFVVARGTSGGFGALGGAARLSRRLGSTALFGTGSLRYETQPQAADPTATAQVRMQWVWATAGVAIATEVPSAPLLVEARLEPTVGWVQAALSGGSSQSAGVLVGAREGVGGTWWWAPWLGLTLGVEAIETTQPVAVRTTADGASYEPVTKAEWFGWSALAGLRLRAE